MTKQEIRDMDRILRESLKKALRSKAAARKFLKDAGVLHLLVPIDETEKKKKKNSSSAKSR
jgi:hypothetical protein